MDARKVDVQNDCNDFSMFSGRGAAAYMSLPSICNWTPTGPLSRSQNSDLLVYSNFLLLLPKEQVPCFCYGARSSEARPMF